jgi:acyl carrier protein
MTTLETKIINIISEIMSIDVSRITADTNLKDLGADSLDGLNIVFEIENQFEIEITDEEIESWDLDALTVNDLVKLVMKGTGGAT